MRALLFLSSLVASLVALVVARDLEIRHKAIPNKRHAQTWVRRGLDTPGNHSSTGVTALDGRAPENRFDNAKFTFYDAGLGACGVTNSNADLIVALNSIQYYDPGGHCFEKITITIGDKSITATIMDQCPGCPYGGLDFSRGLFNFFSNEGVGILYGSWHFGDGTPAIPATTTTPTWNTPTPAPTPTTTYVQVPTPTTTFYPPSSSAGWMFSSSSSMVSSSSTWSALDPSVSYSPIATTCEVLQLFNLALVNLGAIVVVGGSKGGYAV